MKKISQIVLAIGIFCAGAAQANPSDDFFRAVAADNSSAMLTLLLRGFDPNTRDPRGQVALYLALREGSLKVVDALLADPQTRVDLANGAGETPLMMAALRGQLAQAKRLAAKGAQLNREGWTPLHYAASGPGTEVAQWLLEQGAAIDAPSPNGSTPLMMAARHAPEATVDLLLARGADASRRNEQGLAAADFARMAGREALAERLGRPAPR